MSNIILHCAGIDCAGKSTICNNLKKKLNYDIVHFDKPKNLEDGKQQYFSFLNNLNKNVICDRFHDGEHVYAPLYRGYESDYLLDFEKQLKNFPYLLIYVFASENSILERIKSRGEDFLQLKDIKNVFNLYDLYLQKQSMPYIKINTDIWNSKSCIPYIIQAKELVENFHNYKLKYNIFDDYYGNIFADNFIISNNNIKNELIIKNMYKNSWIINSDNEKLINYQFNELKKINTNLKKLDWRK